jgi:2-octaprenyl-6-methoxyphenol hydroxylase
MDSKRSISSFQHLNIEHFTTLLQKKSGGVLGQIHLDTPIQLVKPSQPHCAKTFIAKRTALIGEAAHVFPPIGAQGLNTSLQDIAILLDCVDEAQKAGKDIGIDSSLQQYNQARRNEVFLKFTLLSTLNMMSMNDGFFGHFLRSLGMDILERATPIRKKIMQFGM